MDVYKKKTKFKNITTRAKEQLNNTYLAENGSYHEGLTFPIWSFMYGGGIPSNWAPWKE